MRNSLIEKLSIWKSSSLHRDEELMILSLCVQEGLASKVDEMIIKKADTKFTRNLLMKTLHEASILLEERMQKSTSPKSEKPTRVFGDFDVSGFPDDLKSAHNSLKELYQIRAQQRGILRDVVYTKTGKPKTGYALTKAWQFALSIVELDKTISRIWERLDYFREHQTHLPGTEPHIMATIEKHAAQLLSEQVAAVNYIRKSKNYQKKTGTVQNPEKLRYYQNIIEQIHQFISQHG